MVLGSAQYVRQSDSSVSAPVAIEGLLGAEEDTSTVDHLCDSGRVRFVDSTIRYSIHGPAHWNGRTRLEKTLLVVVLVLVSLSSLLLIMLATRQSEVTELHVHADDQDVCVSRDCVDVAAHILQTADLNMDPCNDFYSFACGSWLRVTEIPYGRTSWNMFEKVWQRNQLILKNELEKAPYRSLNEHPRDAEAKAVAYYKSCLDDLNRIERDAGKPLLNVLKSLDGWPMMQGNLSVVTLTDKQLLQHKLELLHHSYQSGGLFVWSVGSDDKNSTRHIIQIDQGGLSLATRDYYNVSDNSSVAVMEAFEQMMVDVALLLIHDDQNEDNDFEEDKEDNKERMEKLRKDAHDVLEFEKRLANITVPEEKRRQQEDIYHKMSLGQLQEIAPFIDWTIFFQHAFQAASLPTAVDSSMEVVVFAPEYLSALSSLLDEYMSESRRRALENYLVWQLVQSLRTTLSKKYRDAGNILERALLGKESGQERWRTCVTDTDAVLGFALGAMFVRRTTDKETKGIAQSMIASIKNAFERRLRELEWMDELSKREALKKIRAIEDKIGYPDYITDREAVNEKYKRLYVAENEFFQNNIEFHRFAFAENLEKLTQPVNRTRWSMTPPTINAYYTPAKNQIAFPAGILQPPFFKPGFPRSVNFGAMGVVMGHELSHAFDDQGRKYDEHGNKRNWWQPLTDHKFKVRSQCLTDQYSSFQLANLTVKGTKTLGENIADNGGLRMSYWAFKQTERMESVDARLPGLENFSHDQLFFLSFAQVWCSKATEQAQMLQVRDDDHSPARFRVIGVLSNSREFAQAFQCPINSTMNPEHKCEIW